MNHGMIHTFLTMKFIIWPIVWSTYYDRISWSAVCLNWSMFVRRSIENYKNDRCWVEVTSALVLVSILSVELNSDVQDGIISFNGTKFWTCVGSSNLKQSYFYRTHIKRTKSNLLLRFLFSIFVRMMRFTFCCVIHII